MRERSEGDERQMRGRAAAFLPGLAALAALAVLAGCSGIQVDSEFAPNASLDGFETYAWLEHPAEAGYLRAESRFMEARIFTAVDSAMSAKGYRKVEEDAAADFLVVYQVTGTDGIQAGHTYGTFGYSTPARSTPLSGGSLGPLHQGDLDRGHRLTRDGATVAGQRLGVPGGARSGRAGEGGVPVRGEDHREAAEGELTGRRPWRGGPTGSRAG